MKFVKLTSRFRYLYVGHRFDAVAKSPTKSMILACWHEHAVASLLTHGHQGIRPLASLSKDGEMVAQVSKRIGLKCVRGSSSRGGKEARDEMLSLVQEGVTVAITVDGPRGPRHIPKSGCIDLSRKTGAPIIPLVCLSDKFWTLKKTWDQTKIAKPFSRILVCYGEPIVVPNQITKEQFPEYIARLTESLKAWEDQTQRSFEACWKLGIHAKDLK